jgi:DNA gyrase/topoisomerase IV subunit B
LSSSFDLKSTLHPFHTDETRDDNFRLKLLKIISDKFELKNVDNNHLLINFSIDRAVICDRFIDYQELCEKAIQIAVLNRQAEIIIKDLRQKVTCQNYYHFPQGVFYLFDRLMKNTLGKPVFKITFDGMIQNNHYQIGIAYRTDWYPSPAIMSFANEINTVCGGSLVDGVISGLVSSCKMYVKNNDLKTFKIKRQRFFNGLIIVCAVKGEVFNYGGSFRETLEYDDVKRQSAKMVSKLVYDYFEQNKEVAKSFLFRFDESQLVSKMYS